MRAIIVDEPGGPEALEYKDAPDPVPGPGEVLVDVAATAVNRADVMQRRGFYSPPPGAPPYPGLECSGRISALGPDVADAGTWSIGDEVCALLSGGGYAQRVAVPVGQLMPIPSGVDLVDAAALPEVACTVWSNVFMVAGLRTGETLLVHGGGSGIGTFAVQLARARGAKVFVTAGSEAKLEACRKLGAEVGIDYHNEDFAERVLSETAQAGADVILDHIGGSYLAGNISALATEGRLVIIGLMGGRKAELDLARLQIKRASVHATTLRARPPEQKARIVAEVVSAVWPLVESGAIRPIVDRRLPLAEAAEAHTVLESSAHIGKIVLTP